MNIRPCWWICFKQSTPGRKILLLLTIIIWRMGILKVDDSCKGTLEWNLPKQIWHITLYKSTISGQISSRSFVTPIFAGADLGSASATVPEMFPTPRAGQSMKICVLIKKGSGLTDARLWVRSCEYLQWTFHCFRRLLLRHVFRTGFSTLLVWALAIWYFLHGSGFPHHHPEDSFSAGHLECGFQLPREFDCLGYWSRRARVLAFFFVPKKDENNGHMGLKFWRMKFVFFFEHHNISRTTGWLWGIRVVETFLIIEWNWWLWGLECHPRCYTHRSCSAGERSSERSLTLMGSNTAIPPGEPRQCCVYKAFVKYHCYI